MAERRKTGGRPSGLTQAVHDRIVELLQSGCTFEVAAQAAGVARATFYVWLQRGEAAAAADSTDRREAPYRALVEAVAEARAVAEVKALTTIQRAAIQEGSWQAAAWYLERSFPERYAAASKKTGRPVGAASAPDRRPDAETPRPGLLRAVQ